MSLLSDPPISFSFASSRPYVDASLIDEISNQLAVYKIDTKQVPFSFLNIVSTCSSLGSAYTFLVPQILSSYLGPQRTSATKTTHTSANDDGDSDCQYFSDLTANIIHVIPHHKTIKAGAEIELQALPVSAPFTGYRTAADPLTRINGQKYWYEQMQQAEKDQFQILEYGNSFQITPRHSILPSPPLYEPIHAISQFNDGVSLSPTTSSSSSSVSSSSSMSTVHPTDIYTQTISNFKLISSNTSNYNSDSSSSSSISNAHNSSNKSNNNNHQQQQQQHHYLHRYHHHQHNQNQNHQHSHSRSQSVSSVSYSHHSSSSLSTAFSATSGFANDLELRIFNTFAFLPLQTNTLVVPPNSAHYNFALYPMPTHALPSFSEILTARFAELAPSGMLVICFPTSMRLYEEYVLPCLDRALHQMLALNLITSQACESLSSLPERPLLSFEAQRSAIEQLETAEIVYCRHITNYVAVDWGHRWISEDMGWIKRTLSKATGGSVSGLGPRFVEMLTGNDCFRKRSESEVSLFVIRKTQKKPV